MCRKVICAHVLKVGARPSSRYIHTYIPSACAEGMSKVRAERYCLLERTGGRTGIPPSLTHAQILAVFGLGRLRALLLALRNRVVGWPRAFFDQLFAGTVRDVCLRHAAGSFSKTLRDLGRRARFRWGCGIAIGLGILRRWSSSAGYQRSWCACLGCGRLGR